MTDTVRFFRDVLTIDQNLLMMLNPPAGGTVVLGGRQVALSGLLPYYDYVIVADELTIASNAATHLYGAPGPAVTVLAGSITGALAVISAGLPGSTGADGADGESGVQEPADGEPPRGRPVVFPGGNGEPGENGGDGGNGGRIVIHYCSATQVPTASAPGGAGGAGGRGGRGGAGRPPGRSGRNGHSGQAGVPGEIDIAQVFSNELWNALDADSAAAWAAYRAEVAAYLFRKFDPGSQLAALIEARAALLLNPGDPDANEIQSRIALRQIPSGLARDLDIAPDYPDLAADLTAEIAVVQGAFQHYLSVVTIDTIASAIHDSLSAMAVQLINRQMEAQDDIDIAIQDVQIAQTEKSNLQMKINAKQAEINEMSSRSFDLGGVLSTVGTIAGLVGGMATGVGAIISIPAGLAALQRVADGVDLVELLKKLDAKAKDPTNKTPGEEDVDKANNLSGDLKDLVKGTKSVISFPKALADLERAMGMSAQGDTGKLLKEKTILIREQMVAKLRENQAHARVAAAQLRVQNLGYEIADVQYRLSHWSATIENLNAATDTLIRAARRILDMVMEDVFVAQRAREIYEAGGIRGLRFDFGHLHPDQDHSLPPIQRATASLTSLSGFAVQVLAWNQLYHQLNTAQIGFDVIHPELSVSITDPATLQAFAGGTPLEFELDMTTVPEGMYELKVDAMTLSLEGASTAQSGNVWMTHSGFWTMIRRTDASVATMHLLPRSEVFGFSQGTGTLTASIPPNPQSSPETGPPFSFWGRGVATNFRLRLAQPSPMNLSNLSAIHVTIDCIGFAKQGAGVLPSVTTLRPTVRAIAEPAPLEMAVAVN